MTGELRMFKVERWNCLCLNGLHVQLLSGSRYQRVQKSSDLLASGVVHLPHVPLRDAMIPASVSASGWGEPVALDRAGLGMRPSVRRGTSENKTTA